MEKAEDARFGPHTAEVEKLLLWIDAGELLRFGKPLSEQFIPIADLEEALALLRRTPGCVDWTEMRENAETALFQGGILDLPLWLPYKAAINDDLLTMVADGVDAVLPETYRTTLDDVIADLNACAICLALYGKLDPFHDRLWSAYVCGGWPCGCTGDEFEIADDELDLDDRKFYVLWSRRG